MERLQRILFRNFVGVGAFLMLLGTWELLVHAGTLNRSFMPAPSMVLVNTWRLIEAGTLPREMLVSLQRIGAGLGLAIPVGLSAAILSYNCRTIEYAVVPSVELVRHVAPLALLPLFMLIFGIGFASKAAVIFWVSWIPVFLNTLQGMKSTDPMLIKAAKSFGSSRRDLALKVVVPSAAPYILAGIRLALGSALLVLVAAEMLGANSGIGFFILEASQTFRILDMYSAILAVGAIGIGVNWLCLVVADWLTPWRSFTE